jgi:hypothetical protein
MKKLHRVAAGPRWNEGARLSWIALRRLGWNQSQLNKELGTLTGTPPKLGYANKILYGDQRPGREISAALETLLGVPLLAWGQEAREPFSVAMTKTTREAA